MSRSDYGNRGDSSYRKTKGRRQRESALDRFDGQPLQKRRWRDRDAYLFDKGELKDLPGIDRNPERFRSNIQCLIRRYRLSLRELADQAHVEYRWLRRIVESGLSRRVKRLDRVAETLGLPDGDYFWASEIQKFVPDLPPEPEELRTFKQKRNWPYAEKLLELLETENHRYLIELIDALHQAYCSDSGGESSPAGGQIASSSNGWIGKERLASPPWNHSVGGNGEPPRPDT